MLPGTCGLGGLIEAQPAIVAAEQTGLHLLICTKHGQINRRCRISRKGDSTSYRTAVIAPVEADPWPILPDLIPEMGCLIKLFIIIVAEPILLVR